MTTMQLLTSLAITKLSETSTLSAEESNRD